MEDLNEAFNDLHDAIFSLELTDQFMELPVEYRRLACQLRVLTSVAIRSIEDA